MSLFVFVMHDELLDGPVTDILPGMSAILRISDLLDGAEDGPSLTQLGHSRAKSLIQKFMRHSNILRDVGSSA